MGSIGGIVNLGVRDSRMMTLSVDARLFLFLLSQVPLPELQSGSV